METLSTPTGNEQKEAIKPSFASPAPTESLTEIPKNYLQEVCTGDPHKPFKIHSEGISTADETERSELSPRSESDAIPDSSDCATEDPNDKEWSPSEEQNTPDALAIKKSPPKKKKQASSKPSTRSTRRRQKVFELVSNSSKAAMTDEKTQNFEEDDNTEADLKDLFSGNDYIETIQQNNLRPPAPISKSRNKRTALADVLASVPADKKDTAKADKAKFTEASKKWHGLVSHVRGGWKVKGIETGLKPYQVSRFEPPNA